MKLNVSPILFLVTFCAKDGLARWVFDPDGELTLQPSYQCGITEVKRKNTKIVGGEEVEPGQYPWMALLYYDMMDQGNRILAPLCAGSLISRKHILTAAHCIQWDAFGTYAHLGVHSAMEADPGSPCKGSRFIRIKDRIPYDFDKEIPEDIAVFELTSPVRFTPRIRPICLPYSDEEPATAIVAGWGETNSKPRRPDRPTSRRNIAYPPSDVLQHFELQIFPEDNCKDYSTFNGTVNICAGVPGGGQDSCQGDSGGPMFVEEDGISYVVGIVSLGIGCANPNYPGVYTRVSHYLPWIKQLIGSSWK